MKVVVHNLEGAKIVVSGGAGFIGSHLVRRLLALGAGQVLVLDSLRYGNVDNLEIDASQTSRLKVIQFNLGTNSSADLESALDGTDYLFHLAAEKHNQSKDSPAAVVQANINGTLDLYLAAAKAKVKRLVYTSSLYAYGRMTPPLFIETDLPAPRTVYGVSKLAGEHLASFVSTQHGLEFNVLRYFFIYGPRQFAGMGYKSVIVKNFERMLGGLPPVIYGSGKQALDYVFVDDAVEATLQAMQTPVTGEVFNVASGQPVCVTDLIATMQRIAGVNAPPTFEPADWTEGTSRSGSVSKARDTLGWVASTPLEQGLRRTFEWMKNL